MHKIGRIIKPVCAVQARRMINSKMFKPMTLYEFEKVVVPMQVGVVSDVLGLLATVAIYDTTVINNIVLNGVGFATSSIVIIWISNLICKCVFKACILSPYVGALMLLPIPIFFGKRHYDTHYKNP